MNAVAEIIHREIERAGPISFARFMELALYSPDHGYYERQKNIGQRGDFYTSVSVGSLFGELLAHQFADWLGEPGPRRGAPRQIVEAGAHDGRLARDILGTIESAHQSVFEGLEYWILEPSQIRRRWQEETLEAVAAKVRWFGSWETNPRGAVNGIIFSNELLDALPVHRVFWSVARQKWLEWKVAAKNGEFSWTESAVEAGVVTPDLPTQLLAFLPDGFTTEICPAAATWWGQASAALSRGKLLTIDYGLAEEEFFSPQRSTGTARAFAGHHANNDLLREPGEQDLTAQVNFSALQKVGEKAGLKTESLLGQAAFLTAIAERQWKLRGDSPPWTQKQIRQFQTLTHPEHLGRSFRVLIQGRSA